MKPRIGVLTSGGDCPGLNAVLRGVAHAAEKLGWEVVGFRDGFEGLLSPGNHVILDRQSITGIMAHQNYQVRHVPITEAVNRLKVVPPNGEMVHIARDVDISFGD
ncbi:MAG TPA: 6-phosphofructokinase [Candidatus Udaeobacter sp.]|nr:6-phosphofructokinase [Candidatus Udaeobacter sp.]